MNTQNPLEIDVVLHLNLEEAAMLVVALRVAIFEDTSFGNLKNLELEEKLILKIESQLGVVK